jgi:hypothetical protein
MGEQVDALRKRLDADLNKATAEYLRIHRQVNEIISEVPSGLPHPDGRDRIRQAGVLERLAFTRYQKAAERFHAFVDHGIVPDDTGS